MHVHLRKVYCDDAGCQSDDVDGKDCIARTVGFPMMSFALEEDVTWTIPYELIHSFM